MKKQKRFWKCPQCQQVTNPEKLSIHVSECQVWKSKFPDPFPHFKYSPSSQDKKPLFEEGTVESMDYLRCKVCEEFGLDFRFSLLTQHIKVHNLTEEQYVQKYGSLIRLEKSNEKRKATSREKYGADHACASPEVKEKIKKTNLERYGDESAVRSPLIQQRIKETNLERYGVENPFASKDVQKKIYSTMEEKYGAHNPALVPEIVERRRNTCLEKYGAPSALQSKEYLDKVHEKTLERKQERRQALIDSGNFEICHYCNEVFTKINSAHKALCEGWPETEIPYPCICGHESTSRTQMKRHHQKCDVWKNRDVEKIKRERWLRTFQSNHGEEYSSPSQVPEIQEKIKETCRKIYGTDCVLKNEEIKERIEKTCLERYGFPFSLGNPEIRQKAKDSCLVSLGVENPFESFEIQERILRKSLEGFLVFENYENPAKSKQDLIDRYGISHPMQHKEFAYQFLNNQSSENGPNNFEQKIWDLCPDLIWTGNGSFWRWLPLLGRHKNPDFIAPGPDPDFPRRGITKVIEAYGSWWHSEVFTGKDPLSHELETIEAYEEVGIRCLVIWEHEMKDPETVRGRIQEFLSS